MYQLIYHSTADLECSPLILTSILDSSRVNNAVLGVTGLLVCHDDRFIQVLEGSQGAVEDIMGRIMRDDRHRDVAIVFEGHVDQRSFGEWSMAFAEDGSPEANRLIDRLEQEVSQSNSAVLALVAGWVGRAQRV